MWLRVPRSTQREPRRRLRPYQRRAAPYQRRRDHRRYASRLRRSAPRRRSRIPTRHHLPAPPPPDPPRHQLPSPATRTHQLSLMVDRQTGPSTTMGRRVPLWANELSKQQSSEHSPVVDRAEVWVSMRETAAARSTQRPAIVETQQSVGSGELNSGPLLWLTVASDARADLYGRLYLATALTARRVFFVASRCFGVSVLTTGTTNRDRDHDVEGLLS